MPVIEFNGGNGSPEEPIPRARDKKGEKALDDEAEALLSDCSSFRSSFLFSLAFYEWREALKPARLR